MENRSSKLILAFVSGILIGAGIVWLLFNCWSKSCDPSFIIRGDTTTVQKIELLKAKQFFSNYRKDTIISVDTLRAFTLNYEQFVAMQMIARNPNVHGFRIYWGRDDRKQPLTMVVGTGSPDRTDEIYTTSYSGTGPCPRVCDTESEITKD